MQPLQPPMAMLSAPNGSIPSVSNWMVYGSGSSMDTMGSVNSAYSAFCQHSISGDPVGDGHQGNGQYDAVYSKQSGYGLVSNTNK